MHLLFTCTLNEDCRISDSRKFEMMFQQKHMTLDNQQFQFKIPITEKENPILVILRGLTYLDATEIKRINIETQSI